MVTNCFSEASGSRVDGAHIATTERNSHPTESEIQRVNEYDKICPSPYILLGHMDDIEKGPRSGPLFSS